MTGSTGASAIRPWLLLLLVAIGVAVTPLVLRPLNRAVVGDLPSLGYLPALEIRRPHGPFRAVTVDELRISDPEWVFIGDSMLGTRIDPGLLRRISGHGDRNVSFLYHPATGPAWWYLTFKNHLIASGVRPRMTFFFFRDTNLTDTMFRLEGHYGNALDEVATASEPELDRLVAAHRKGAWHRVHRFIDATYEANVATSWVEPAIRRWWVHWRDPRAGVVEAFEWNLERIFSVDAIRYDVPADLAATDVTDVADFARDLPTSVLPLIVNLSKEHGVPVCFVRVQRRPTEDGPPEQSPELVRYVADMKAWVEDNGACFHDDTGDPAQTLDLYEDGDHVADRRRYTENFRKRLDPLFRPLERTQTP
ncbi:MAG: hypothetical protein IT178_10200 [Acidobacteria bacterium]|nr:hypothetical protein [Acidobacteriota bacterium]